MNQSLKAILDELLDLEKVAVDVVGKKDFSAVTVMDLMTAGKDIPAVVSNFSDLKAEIAALTNTANQADLEAYVISKIGGVSTKAAGIIEAAVACVLAGEKLFIAIKA